MDTFFILSYSNHDAQMNAMENYRAKSIPHSGATMERDGKLSTVILTNTPLGTPILKLFLDSDNRIKDVVTGEELGTIRAIPMHEAGQHKFTITAKDQNKTIVFAIIKDDIQLQ